MSSFLTDDFWCVCICCFSFDRYSGHEWWICACWTQEDRDDNPWRWDAKAPYLQCKYDAEWRRLCCFHKYGSRVWWKWLWGSSWWGCLMGEDSWFSQNCKGKSISYAQKEKEKEKRQYHVAVRSHISSEMMCSMGKVYLVWTFENSHVIFT